MKMIEKMARKMAAHARVSENIGWRLYSGHARAALTVLLDPNEDMIVAGEKHYDCEFLVDGSFKAMIQHALDETTP